MSWFSDMVRSALQPVYDWSDHRAYERAIAREDAEREELAEANAYDWERERELQDDIDVGAVSVEYTDDGVWIDKEFYSHDSIPPFSTLPADARTADYDSLNQGERDELLQGAAREGARVADADWRAWDADVAGRPADEIGNLRNDAEWERDNAAAAGGWFTEDEWAERLAAVRAEREDGREDFYDTVRESCDDTADDVAGR